jgi:NADPH2:quinone reductase
VDVLGFYWGGYMGFAPQVLLNSLRDVFAMISKGQLNPHIGGSYDLDHALEAVADLKARTSIGKLVVRGPI